MKKEEDIKVFRFARNGDSYVVAASSKSEARNHLLNSHKVSMVNCYEIHPSDWDSHIRESLSGDYPQLISRYEKGNS